MQALRNPSLFNRDERGNIAIQFGLAIVPMMMMVGAAVDLGQALHAHTEVQAAADSGALAAAAATKSSNSARIELANAMITQNISNKKMTSVQKSVTVEGSQVRVEVEARMGTNFLGIMNVQSIPVRAHAVAKSSYDPTTVTSSTDTGKICILALDPNSDDGIHVQGNNFVQYPNCWGYTNSTKATAINGNGSQARVNGQGHCSSGGFSATHPDLTYSPTVRTGCAPVADPYASVGAYSGGTYTATFTAPPLPTACVANSMTLRKGSFTLIPGRYCGGLTVMAQATVQLVPGIYYFDNGPFDVRSGASVTLKTAGYTASELNAKNGEGVLLYLAGTNATMTIIGGGTINLQGRRSGSSYAGFLAIAKADVVPSTPATWAYKTTNIQGGGTFNMEGVIYMPTQRIDVAGMGDVNNSSLYYGMIAKDFYFRGNGVFNASKRQSSSQLPDILPDMPQEQAKDAFLKE